MEPATHTLTGYLMSRTGLRDWCPGATPVLLLAANVPDIDFAAWLGGDLTLLDWHRGPTHALFSVALMALLPLLLVRPFLRRPFSWRRAYAVSVLGVLSHLALDGMNIYGVRYLEPFRKEYFGLGVAAVADLWLLAGLLAAAGWLLISRLVSAEIGAAPVRGRRMAWAGLAFVLLWVGGRYVLRERAATVLESWLYGGEAPVRVAALPRFATPFSWVGLVETNSAYRLIDIDLLSGNFDPSGGRTFYKPEPSPAIEAARRTDTYRRFSRFLAYEMWRVLPAAEPAGAMEVQVTDMRFSWPGEGRFTAMFLVDASGRVLEEKFQIRPPGQGPRLR